MTLDELSVVFSADTAPFAAAVGNLSALLSAAAAQADAAVSQFQAAGGHAGDGLRNGLLSRRSSVAAAAKALADAAANALRGALNIHSPSKLTYQVGAYFDEGLLEGISASAWQVEREADALGRSAAQALQVPAFTPPPVPLSPVFSPSAPAAPSDAALAPISLTIPLEIDGYRLGVAAIEGINRVTQGTGRVELTL